jgi:hypothetical protein
MIHQKEFTAFPFFPFFRYCFSLLNDNKTNYKKRLCYSMTQGSFFFLSFFSSQKSLTEDRKVQPSVAVPSLSAGPHPSSFLHGDLTSAGQRRGKRSINNDIIRINEMPAALLYINTTPWATSGARKRKTRSARCVCVCVTQSPLSPR